MIAHERLRGVCFLGYGLHPPWNEGTRVVTRDLMRSLQGTSNLTVKGVSTRRRDEDTTTELDISYVRESVVGDLAEAAGWYRYNLDFPMFARLGVRLREVVADCDLVHAGFASHTMFSLLNDALLGKTFVAQTFGGLEHRRVLELLDTPDRIDAYVSTSAGDIEELLALGVPERKVHRVRPPVFVERGGDFDRVEARQSYGIDEGAFVVGYFGNVNETRFPFSVAERLDRFAVHSGVEAVVVTKQIEDRDVRSLENLRVITGHLSERDKQLVYKLADVWMFPFRFIDHSSAPVIDPPLTVLEAMAAGRPVIASAVLSIPEVIEHGRNGFLHDADDVDGFFESIDRLRDDELAREAIGRRARETIEREYRPDAVAEQLLGVYEEAINDA